MTDENKLLFDFLAQTERPLFLTGKAGTGKTTLLHTIKNTTNKNVVVVAPTAVAALNAGGVTIHSFFQLPFGPLLPAETSDLNVHYAPDKLKILKCLDLLIIDEISMVRADTLDYLDAVLKKIRTSQRPFGGIQVLMIGDLFQLPPVSHNDWPILKNFYQSHYFFDSHIFRSTPMVMFELTHIYRQSDPVFIDILNGIRENKISDELLQKLNSRYNDTKHDSTEGYITLTTHNKLVGEVNQKKLESLPGNIYVYKAVITGDFPKDAYPADEELKLKEGAQVIITKNDPSGKKQYYNGRAAIVIVLTANSVKVQFLDDRSEFHLNPEVWNNVKYDLDQSDSKVSESNAGSFTQYPLKLAWAITVHKSQGLTFDNAIVDVSASFTHGQSYVALSRCRSLSGLILNSTVTQQNIITDPIVTEFMKITSKQKPDFEMLKSIITMESYQFLDDMMDFSALKNDWDKLANVLVNNTVEAAFGKELIGNRIIGVANQFSKKELAQLDNSIPLAKQDLLLDRLKDAGIYFIPKIDQATAFINNLFLLPFEPKIETQLFDLLNNCLNILVLKHTFFKIMQKSFNLDECRQAVKSSNLEYKSRKKSVSFKKEIVITNTRLYDELLSWRKEFSEKKNTPDYLVLAEKTVKFVANKMPKTLDELAAINGIGPVKAVEIGEAVLKIIAMHTGVQQLF